MSLIPLTTYLEEKTYNFGEIIVKEGDEAENFYIVSRGRLKVIKQQSIERNLKIMEQENKKFGRYRLQYGYVDYVDMAVNKNLTKSVKDVGVPIEEKEDLTEKVEEIQFKFCKDHRHPNIIIDPSTQIPTHVYCQNDARVKHDQIILMEPLLEKKNKYELEFYIDALSDQSDIGIGICYKNKMETKNYTLSDKKLGNGIFAVYSNGETYSDISDTENCKFFPEKFNFLQGHTIQVNIDPFSKTMTFLNRNNQMQFSIQIVFKNYDYFAPCVFMRNSGDSISFVSAKQIFVPQKKTNEFVYYEDKPEHALQYKKEQNQPTGKFKFTYNSEFGTMCRGDYFMGRALIQEYLKLDPSFGQELKYNVSGPAKLTIVADSSVCKVFQMSRYSIHMIQAALRKQIINGVSSRAEYDHVYDDAMDTWTKEWDQFKVNVLQNVLTDRDLTKKINTNNHKNNED